MTESAHGAVTLACHGAKCFLEQRLKPPDQYYVRCQPMLTLFLQVSGLGIYLRWSWARLVTWLCAFVELSMFNASCGYCASTPFITTATRTLSCFGVMSSEQILGLRNEQPIVFLFPLNPTTHQEQGEIEMILRQQGQAWPYAHLLFHFFLQSSSPTSILILLFPTHFMQSIQLVGSVFPWIQAFNFRCGCWLFQILLIMSNLMGKEAVGR